MYLPFFFFVRGPYQPFNTNSLFFLFVLPRTYYYLALQRHFKKFFANGSLGQGSAQEEETGKVTQIPGR